MSKGQPIPRSDALPPAQKVIDALRPISQMLMVCGSIRRGLERVRDVDIVYVPRPIVYASRGLGLVTESTEGVDTTVPLTMETAFTRTLSKTEAEMFEQIAISVLSGIAGAEMVQGRAKLQGLHVDGVQIDLWAVPEESYGAATLFATGSMELNVAMRQVARRMGLKLSQYGLFSQKPHPTKPKELVENVCLASRNEEDVFRALNLAYLDPADRSLTSPYQQLPCYEAGSDPLAEF